MREERAPVRAGRAGRSAGGASRRTAAFAVRYLRAVASAGFLGMVRVFPGQDVRRHDAEGFLEVPGPPRRPHRPHLETRG